MGSPTLPPPHRTDLGQETTVVKLPELGDQNFGDFLADKGKEDERTKRL
jgi:hypothetical protein